MQPYETWSALVASLAAILQAGPFTYWLVELLKRAGLRGRRRIRTIAALVSVVGVTLLTCAYGLIPWPAAPIVALLAWGAAEGTHRKVNGNLGGGEAGRLPG